MSELIVALPYGAVSPDEGVEKRLERFEAVRFDEPVIFPKPRVIGRIANREAFSAPHDHRGDFRLPFSIDPTKAEVKYEIPPGLAQLQEAIEIIAKHEHGNFPHEQRPAPTQADATIDQSIVEPGETQRGDRIHLDGHMGRWENIYLVSSSSPTEFFWTDEPACLKFRGMGLSGEIEKEGLEGPYVPGDYEIVLANSTVPHASPVVQEGGPRTFLRVAYEHSLEITGN